MCSINVIFLNLSAFLSMVLKQLISCDCKNESYKNTFHQNVSVLGDIKSQSSFLKEQITRLY